MSGAPGEVFRFAHLSDPHLTDLRGATLRQLAGKRALGYLSWQRRRRREHLPQVLAALRADLRSRAPDHTVLTGDLAQISLPQEFLQARDWLATLGAPDAVTVVPGNHDAYVRVPWQESIGLWSAYFRSDTAADPPFPLLRVRGPVVFVGLNTAVPTPPLFATGRVGTRQMHVLEQLLARLPGHGQLRVLLLHHPPVPGSEKRRKRLTDARELCTLLARHPVDLVLHGHQHRASQSTIHADGREIPVFGLASASAAGIHTRHPSAYNEYEIETGVASWRLRASARCWDPATRSFHSEALAEFACTRPASG